MTGLRRRLIASSALVAAPVGLQPSSERERVSRIELADLARVAARLTLPPALVSLPCDVVVSHHLAMPGGRLARPTGGRVRALDGLISRGLESRQDLRPRASR